jgi:hypothetical protein
VTPGEQMNPQLAGPSFDLDAVEQADREKRGVHDNTVHAGSDIGHAVEVILGRCTSPSLEADWLRPPDVSAAPEKDTRHLCQQVADCARMAPFN